MEMILATKSSTPIIGQLATVMGWIMDGIYRLLNIFGIQNIGLCIVIFSILIYALMTPLQIKQQKFSKLSAIMQPELQKIQKKYKGKNNDHGCNAENAGGNTGCISEIRRISYRKLCTACNPVPYSDGLISGNL